MLDTKDPEVAEVLKALRDLWHQVETGRLVRNTDGDKDPQWAFKSLELVQSIKLAYDVVQKWREF